MWKSMSGLLQLVLRNDDHVWHDSSGPNSEVGWDTVRTFPPSTHLIMAPSTHLTYHGPLHVITPRKSGKYARRYWIKCGNWARSPSFRCACCMQLDRHRYQERRRMRCNHRCSVNSGFSYFKFHAGLGHATSHADLYLTLRGLRVLGDASFVLPCPH